MLWPFFPSLAAAALTVTATPTQYSHIILPKDDASPTIPHEDLVAVAAAMPLQKRISRDFDLMHQVNDKTIFSGNLISVGSPTKITSLKVTCKECSTKGTITAKLTTEDIVKPVVRFELKSVEATVHMDLASTGTLAFTLNLFTSETPFGISILGLKLGLLFSVDLAFSLSNPLDIDGGFHMKPLDDAFFELDVFDGDITDKSFDGSGFHAIPITAKGGAAAFKADLRLRVDLAAAAGISVFANLAEFVAQVNRTDDCFLQAREFFDLNVGATASAGIGAELKTFNVVPGVSTTLLTSPTETQCIFKYNPVEALKPMSSMPSWNITQPTLDRNSRLQLHMVTSASAILVTAPTSYVITTCASDIINCPPSLASIITVAQAVDAASASSASTAFTEGAAVESTSVSYIYLSAMATPVINSIATKSSS